ncbi:MAG TPA: ATP-binding protein, partial [Planctomycetaceae bacterium]|nr:ATP-binding protein [Planctomycetaceae bacterium]
MQDFEKLGLFYLGREYDVAAGKRRDGLVLYDSRDLVTHAVCVGMTGSGKTGLCLSLIEEAAIDGVPVIAIDPKGDLGNLLLTFPSLAASDFRRWIDEDEARRAGLAPDAFAAKQAELWQQGLADWGEDGARIDRLRKAADFSIYTPGSRAGLPVSLLQSFTAPPAAIRGDAELLGERAASTAISLLSLAGVDAPPRSREHTLVSSVLSTAWTAGKNLDLPTVIEQIQSPPFQKVGVVDLEAFFPKKDRFDLAMRFNAVLAAPGFDQWFEGDPLDPARLLYTSDGRPRVAVFSIAHLGDSERMFFVSLLLNQVLGWMRTQTGTTSLRAIVYMDEIAGYFPPVANPPSKTPLLTLLKQGRAFGLGVVLATQNPVDLDYKGLSNIGTWFLGRLQTERDKARMLDGLEGASAGSFDRGAVDRILSALQKRVFLLHNVHDDHLVTFETRWTLSYLRGPLSREQIRALMVDKVKPAATPQPKPDAVAPAAAPATASESASDRLPVLPPGIDQFFLPRPSSGSIKPLLYSPVVLGAVRVGFSDAKLGVDEVRDLIYAASVGDGPLALDWARAERLDLGVESLARSPEQGSSFESLPSAAAQPKNYAVWEKSFKQWLTQNERIQLMRHRETGLTSRPGESEGDFKVRVQDAARASRDAAVDAVRQKYAARQAA